MTKAARACDLERILGNRISLAELQATRLDALQVQRQTYLYNGIVDCFENLLSAYSARKAARSYLLNLNLVSNPETLAAYEYFAGYSSFHLAANPASALTEIEALYSEFVSWGFSASTLRSLLSLQNISL